LTLAVGIDPGASAGVAAVAWSGSGRPRLLYAANVRASTDALWWQRAVAHLEAVQRALLDTLDPEALAGSADRCLAAVPVWIEEPPPATTRDSRLAGDKRGMMSWYGMGRRAGLLTAATLEVGLPAPERIAQRRWVHLHHPGTVRRRKVQVRGIPIHGWHRVAEASLVVEGAELVLAELAAQSSRAAQSGAVDVAEAILMAAAACFDQAPGAQSAVARGGRR